MATKRPHICFVAPSAFPILAGDESTPFVGGAEVQQVMVAKGLAERGYQVSMICHDLGQEDGIEIEGVKVFRSYKPDEGIPVVRFLWPRMMGTWACLKRVDADIYYQRSASVLTGVVSAFCSRHEKKSIFAAAGNPNFDRNTSRIRFRRDRWIYEYGLRRVDRILVQNEEQARLCQSNFGRDTILVPSCYQPQPLLQREARRQVLWVSTIRTLKRPELFLELAATLPQYRFKMVGGPGSGIADRRLFETVRTRAASLENLEFVGFVPYRKVEEHFNQAAVLVNTSETEGFPNTFLQAWSREVPTVSFVDSGARMDGRPVGRTVQSMDELVSVLAELMSNESARLREGEASRRYVERSHSLSHVLGIYEGVISELLNT